MSVRPVETGVNPSHSDIEMTQVALVNTLEQSGIDGYPPGTIEFDRALEPGSFFRIDSGFLDEKIKWIKTVASGPAAKGSVL
eukprot:1673306-Prymnesium_polylepis.1